ncbi:CAMP-specific 3',5'-cyclic phosphodiesterase 7b, partial [Plakobranchus ocellatus]
RSVFYIAYHLFQTYDLIRSFRLDTVRLLHFFSLVEANYHESNPYHNAVHAADVTQSMHCYLQEKEVGGTVLLRGFRAEFFDQLKALILATDITRQQEFLLKFCRCIESEEFDYKANEEHRLIMLQIALKCADISNPCREWRVSQRWSRRVCHEFFLQGDTERSLQVPVTPLCDRFGNTVANIQHGFMQFVARPLFRTWDQFMQTPLTGKMLSHLTANQASWKAIMDGLATNKTVRSLAGGDGAVRGDDSSDSEAGYEEFTEEEDLELEQVGEERMDVVESTKEDEEEKVESVIEVKSNVTIETPLMKTVTLVLPPGVEEEEEGRSEAADVVPNDVNLLYHYQTDSEESGAAGLVGAGGPRCLSPVSEGGELPSFGGVSRSDALYNSNNNNNNGRRFSVPAIVSVRKDLSFYLGLRRDSAGPSPSSSSTSFGSLTNSCSYNAFLRRQSLPTTAIYVHGSSHASVSEAPDLASVSPRSLSVDALLARPKITSLSSGGYGDMGPFSRGFPSTSLTYSNSNMGAGMCSSTPSQSDSALAGNVAADSGGLTPLYNQTLLLLHGGDMTRFTSNPTVRRASYEPGLAEHTRQGTNCPRPHRDNEVTTGYSGGRRLTLPAGGSTHRDQNHPDRRQHNSSSARKAFQQEKHLNHQPRVGLAASWPVLATKRRTTNGTTYIKNFTSTSDEHDKSSEKDKPFIIDKTSESVMEAASPSPSHDLFSSSQSSSSAAIYAESTKPRAGNPALFHSRLHPQSDAKTPELSSSSCVQAFTANPSASQLCQPVTAEESSHIDSGQEDGIRPHLYEADQTGESGPRTNPHCLSLTSSTSSSAQEDNHPPRPQ